MINAGFNPLQQISEKTGKSIAQLKEEMSKGAISAEMVQQAFLDATSAGGKFYNMSENASKTINGQISMMQDAMDAVFNEIGTKTEGIIIKSIKAATSLIQNYEKIGKVLVGLVTTYGAYRTAVFLATAATSKQTIAEIALTNVRIAARKAQMALNAAMLTNPYVALATVVAGLAATMWALRDSTTAAERAQKDFNSMKEESARKEKEHANAIQGLIEKVRDETQANTDRIAAMVALKQEYPNIFEQYDIEKLKLADILDIQRQINEEDARRRRQNAVASIAAQEGRVKAIESMRQTPSWAGRNMFASDKNFDQAIELLKQQRNDYLMTYSLPEFAKTLKGKTEEQLNEVLNSLKQTNYFSGSTFTDALLGELKMADIKNIYPDFYKALGDAVNTELQSRQPSGIDYATAKKEWDAAKRALADIEKDKDKFTDEQRQAAIDRKKKAGDAFKGLSFSAEYEVAEEEWKDAKKALEDIEKDKDKFSTAQYKAAETRKDTAETNFKKLGGDTTGKTDRSAAQTYNEQLAQQEKVRTAQEKSDRERVRTTEDMEMMIEQARISAMKDGEKKRRAQRELDNRKELQSLERQKQEYIEKTVEGEKAIFDAQEEQKAKNDEKYKKQTFDKEAAKKRVETTDPVVQQYTKVIKYTEQRQTQDATKEDMGAWRDSMNTYLREYGDYEGKKLAMTQEYEQKIAEAANVWEKGALTQKMKEELAALDIEANKTTNAIAQLFGDMRDKTVKELDGIAQKGTQALEFLKGGEWDETKGKELGISKETFEIWSKSPEKLKAIADALDGVRDAAEGLRNPLGKIVDGFKDLFDSAGDKNKFKEAFSLISAGVGEVSDAIGFVSDSLASMGEALGSEGLTKAADAINSALNVAGQTMQGAQAGAAFGPWGAAIGAVAGLASSLVTEISKAKDAIHDAEIERLAKEVETLDKSYDSLGKSIEKAFSADASKLIEQQNTLLEQKKANLKLMIAEEQAKKNVDDEQVAAWIQQIEEIDEAIQGNKESAIEALAGQDVMSAIDSFASAYADAWTNGADAAEASTKAVRNILRTSLLEFLKGQLSDEVTAFNERLADAMKDGIINPWEEEQLDRLREKMDEEAQRYYEQTSQYWDDGEDDTVSQQTASRKGYETLSEDTGNELVGRATAQYESNLRMEEATRSMKESVDLLTANQVQIRDIAAESRAMIASSYAELKQISENTGAIIKPIGAIKVAVEEMNKKIDQL